MYGNAAATTAAAVFFLCCSSLVCADEASGRIDWRKLLAADVVHFHDDAFSLRCCMV